MTSDKKKIVILGGGFGGVYTARHLSKLLKPDEASVTLINRENYSVYQPMLPEVISGSIGLTDVVSPIRQLSPRTLLITREVESIDLNARTVTVSPGFRPRSMEVPYDHLVIALGAITDYSGKPGLLEHAMPFRTLADALSLRSHLIHVLEEAELESDPQFRKKLLSFVVAGGGFSGVEVIAELHDFVHLVKDNYPRLRHEEIRCVLVHSGDRILPEIAAHLAVFAHKLLAKRGVEIRLLDRLVTATSERAILKSGIEIPTKTVISTVPMAIAPVLQKLDCAKDKGRLRVNSKLELAGYEGQVWALGDCVSLLTKSGSPVPPTAQHATREARVVAGNIVANIRGGEAAEFDFEGLGKLGSLGRYSAVADILGFRVSGLPAWILWRTIYLMKMPSLYRKVRVGFDWIIALFFHPDLVQVRDVNESSFVRQHFEPGDVVFFQGELGDCVYVIERGECEVFREQEGTMEHVAILRADDYFGEMAVLTDSTRNATVLARTPMDVLLISKTDFQLLKSSVPAFGEFFSKLARDRASPISRGTSAS
ncbi:MAG: FAD-dependent oxidoreductase [Candidatus Acidiferrales bacterium]